MCDGCEPTTYEDVRATKPHEVALGLIVQAEDAGKAVERVTDALRGIGDIQRITGAGLVEQYDDEEPW